MTCIHKALQDTHGVARLGLGRALTQIKGCLEDRLSKWFPLVRAYDSQESCKSVLREGNNLLICRLQYV